VATEYSQNSVAFLSNEPNGFRLGSAQKLTGFFVSMDGGGNAWFGVQDSTCTTNGASCIGSVELSPAGSLVSGPLGYKAGGFTAGGSGTHAGVAIDGSGNEWIANTTADSVTELIGVAVPVVTPLAAAVAANTLATRP
jgi:hypothetical protein